MLGEDQICFSYSKLQYHRGAVILKLRGKQNTDSYLGVGVYLYSEMGQWRNIFSYFNF